MSARLQLLVAMAMLAAYAADDLWVKPRARHADFAASRDCLFNQRCWIR